MKLHMLLAGLALIGLGCGDGGGSPGGGSTGPQSGATIIAAGDFDGNGQDDMATIDTGAAPGSRVSDVVTKNPTTGQYSTLSKFAVSNDVLNGLLSWDATTPLGPGNEEATLTIMDGSTPKAVIVRRLP